MKRSDFLLQHSSAWESGQGSFLTCKAAFLEVTVSGAEAAGVVWDPEDPELPEVLEMGGRHVFFRSPEERTATDNQIATAILYTCAPQHPCSLFNERVLREAVRRYNAWKKLQELSRYRPGETANSYLDKLAEILKGEPHG